MGYYNYYTELETLCDLIYLVHIMMSCMVGYLLLFCYDVQIMVCELSQLNCELAELKDMFKKIIC